MRAMAVVCALLVLAACDRTPDPVAPDASASATPAANKSPAAQPSPVQDAPASERREVTLAPDGIIMVGAVDGRGTATTLDFGRDQANTLAVMKVDLGKPKLTKLAECGAGPMEFAAYGPLTLNFLGGKFVGWRAERGAQVVTVDGFQLGTTLPEIKTERSARRIPETTLEGEFEYASGDGGMIGGFLQGAGDTAKVASFHAGTTCFFR